MATVSPTWQEKLKTYGKDTAAAQAEIARAKDVYAKATTAAAKAAASKWASQVRTASGISADDATYGNNKATFGKPVTPIESVVKEETPIIKEETPEEKARKYAEEQSNAKYNASKNAITAMMERLQKQRESSIKSAEMGAEASRQGLEASAFKSARDAQQAMAGRGLIGTGIAADVGARQGMAKQAELAALYGNLNKTTADINTQADLSNDELNQELKTLEANKGSMTEEMYQTQLDRLMNREANQAQFTGKYMGEDTMATKEAAKAEAWKTAEATGVIPDSLADSIGVPRGTKTRDAVNDAFTKAITMSGVTGQFKDPVTGKTVTTKAEEDRVMGNLIAQANLTGKITGQLAKVLGVKDGTPTLEGYQAITSRIGANTKSSGTGTSYTTDDLTGITMSVSDDISNAYYSVADTDKKGNKLDPKQVKSARDAKAQEVFFREVKKLTLDPKLTPEQRLDIAKKWASGENGVGAKSWAKAQEMLGVKTSTTKTDKTTQDKPKSSKLSLADAVKSGNKQAVSDQKAIKELEAKIKARNEKDRKQQLKNYVALIGSEKGFKFNPRMGTMEDERLANLKKKTY